MVLTVFLQQLQTLGHNVDPVLRELRVPSQNLPASSIPKSPIHPDLFTQVPPAYHDFLDVFSEQQANTLPPHRKYDLHINLLPSKAPLWGRIYTQSAVELVEMKAYIKAYLANGFIRPS